MYRCVLTEDRDNPSFVDSFKSNYERGKRPRRVEMKFTPAHMGLSTWLAREQAASIGRLFPETAGEFTAEVRLAPEIGAAFARTGPPGHLTIWGRAPQLALVAVDILPI